MAIMRSMTATATNADDAELRKFSDLAHAWWDPQGELRSLHDINPLRLDWIDRQAPLKGQRVLDVGCGGGILTHAMAAMGADALGIDLSSKSLKIAKLHALETGGEFAERYQEVSAEALAQDQAGAFDVVTCMEMLEHVPDPGSVVEACARLVKPGGWVFFSTINRNWKSLTQAIIGAEYLLGLVPKGTHEYAKLIRPSELAEACRASGLHWHSTQGLSYNPLSQRYFLTPKIDVNYMVATRKEATP